MGVRRTSAGRIGPCRRGTERIAAQAPSQATIDPEIAGGTTVTRAKSRPWDSARRGRISGRARDRREPPTRKNRPAQTSYQAVHQPHRALQAARLWADERMSRVVTQRVQRREARDSCRRSHRRIRSALKASPDVHASTVPSRRETRSRETTDSSRSASPATQPLHSIAQSVRAVLKPNWRDHATAPASTRIARPGPLRAPST